MAQKQQSRRPAPAHDNFLEALRDLGRGVVSDVKQSFGLSGELRPNEPFSLEQNPTPRPNYLSQERLLFLHQEEETKKQIKYIQEEIHMLAKTAGEFTKEVQVATFQAPASPGVYHKNFFYHLRSYIQTIRQQIEQSRHWLATTNSRTSKRSYYWGQVGKSGTKFMLSQERYMVTSTG